MAYKPKKKIKDDIKKEIFLAVGESNNLKPGANHPDPKLHQIVSFIKSGMRIIGYCLIPYNLGIAASILVLSEVVGIIEELV